MAGEVKKDLPDFPSITDRCAMKETFFGVK
jgi:hypothetical protein